MACINAPSRGAHPELYCQGEVPQLGFQVGGLTMGYDEFLACPKCGPGTDVVGVRINGKRCCDCGAEFTRDQARTAAWHWAIAEGIARQGKVI